ncbi:hypothetical protein [Streptomyces sp. NPDC059828]|uniref:hypothetical protein n=1 Tax=Streptomyces sp. NPDC059828 TaxID=3346965 RepID=UPI00365B7E76
MNSDAKLLESVETVESGMEGGRDLACFLLALDRPHGDGARSLVGLRHCASECQVSAETFGDEGLELPPGKSWVNRLAAGVLGRY